MAIDLVARRNLHGCTAKSAYASIIYSNRSTRLNRSGKLQDSRPALPRSARASHGESRRARRQDLPQRGLAKSAKPLRRSAADSSLALLTPLETVENHWRRRGDDHGQTDSDVIGRIARATRMGLKHFREPWCDLRGVGSPKPSSLRAVVRRFLARSGLRRQPTSAPGTPGSNR